MTLDEQNDLALQDEIRALVQSKAWRTMRVYLLNRRAILFAEEPTTQYQLWRNRGALTEVNNMLRAPEAALFEMARNQVAGDPLPEEMAPAWNPFATVREDQ